jgi:hypothetical protein
MTQEANTPKLEKEAAESKKSGNEGTPVAAEASKAKVVAEPPSEGKKKRAVIHRMRSEEQQYFNATAQKFREENTGLLTLSLFLAGCSMISLSLCMQWKTAESYVAVFYYIAMFVFVFAEITLFGSTMLILLSNALFARFLVLASQETRLGDKKYLQDLFSGGYAYKQAAKVSAMSGVAALCAVVLLLLAYYNILLALCLVLLCGLFAAGIYSYMSAIKKAGKASRKPLPLLEEDVSNVFPGTLPREPEEKPDLDERLQLASLLAILKSSVTKVRRDAIKMIGKLNTSEVITAVIPALSDPAPEVRAQAVSVLGKTGEKSMREPLKCLLYDEAPEVRAAIVEALGNLGDEDAFDRLVQSLDDPAPEVRGTAAEAMAELGHKKAVKYIVPKIKDKDWYVRHKVVIALGKIKGDLSLDALEQLIEAVKDEHQYVASAVRHLLRKIHHEMSPKDTMYDEIKNILAKAGEDKAGQDSPSVEIGGAEMLITQASEGMQENAGEAPPESGKTDEEKT